jgi:hypothetical protein
MYSDRQLKILITDLGEYFGYYGLIREQHFGEIESLCRTIVAEADALKRDLINEKLQSQIEKSDSQ